MTLTKKDRRLTALCALLLAALVAALSVFDYSTSAAKVRDDVLRLHILADSDSTEDQAVKQLVRDRLLAEANTLFQGDITPDTAAQILGPALPRLTAIAETVLRENGMDYGAKAYLTTEYFDTRAYGDFTLPAGTYTALRIVLGSGRGQNWWCVMFPPLCLPAAEGGTEAEAVFSGDAWRIVHPAEGYQIRFKIVEIFAWIRNKAEGKKQ